VIRPFDVSDWQFHLRVLAPFLLWSVKGGYHWLIAIKFYFSRDSIFCDIWLVVSA